MCCCSRRAASRWAGGCRPAWRRGWRTCCSASLASRSSCGGPEPANGRATPRRGVVLVVRIPHIDWPRPRLLDLYIARLYLVVFMLSFAALIGVFYISTFIDLADKLYRGSATPRLLARFFYWQTPQYVFYIIPLSALVAALVTIGLLTKNSE